MITRLKHNIKRFLFADNTLDTPSEAAYNLWATAYDNQPNNLMLALDEEVFNELLADINISNRAVADMGCGTGRHWIKLLAQKPSTLTGYDVSDGMLRQLKQKYPQAHVVKIKPNEVPVLADQSIDCIISTLTIAHIANLDKLIRVWANGLKPDAKVIITDFHPTALAMGGKRTFSHQKKQVSICNYVHPLDMLIAKFALYGFELTALKERFVDETVKPYYQKQNALPVYENFKGQPIIYGMCLTRKADAA